MCQCRCPGAGAAAAAGVYLYTVRSRPGNRLIRVSTIRRFRIVSIRRGGCVFLFLSFTSHWVRELGGLYGASSSCLWRRSIRKPRRHVYICVYIPYCIKSETEKVLYSLSKKNHFNLIYMFSLNDWFLCWNILADCRGMTDSQSGKSTGHPPTSTVTATSSSSTLGMSSSFPSFFF